MSIHHCADKIHYEYLAKVILETALPKKYHDLELKDKPDLYAPTGEGIEVTRATPPEDEEASNRWRRNIGKTLEEVSTSDLQRIDSLGYEFFLWDDRVYGVGAKEAEIVTTSEVERAFKQKCGKVHTYGENVSLFIYAPIFDSYSIDMMKQFSEWAIGLQAGMPGKFNKVFIFDFETLFMCDLTTSHVQSFSFPNDRIKQCVEKVRSYISTQQ